jgi:hypothetical protein
MPTGRAKNPGLTGNPRDKGSKLGGWGLGAYRSDHAPIEL